MMEMLKRHAFLIGLVGGVVVLGAVLIVVTFLGYWSPNARMRRTLQTARTQATTLLGSPLFTEDLVKKMGDQVTLRKNVYDDLLDYVRKMGAARKPAVENLFPAATDNNLRHLFKPAYDAALDRFMKRLGAVTPGVVLDKDGKPNEAEQAFREREFRKAPMFAHLKASFFRPDWVDSQQAPSPDTVRYGQENLWLMEDLVEIIATMNEEVRRRDGLDAGIGGSPVKELDSILISGEYATLANTKMTTVPGRYRVAPALRTGVGEKEKTELKAATLTGRYSEPGFYRVLPFRMVVVVEARYVGEFLRRLKGRETFITTEAWRLTPVTDASFERARGDALALSREDYGSRGVVRLEVVAESLVFQLEGGRLTTLPKAAASPAPATPEASG